MTSKSRSGTYFLFFGPLCIFVVMLCVVEGIKGIAVEIKGVVKLRLAHIGVESVLTGAVLLFLWITFRKSCSRDCCCCWPRCCCTSRRCCSCGCSSLRCFCWKTKILISKKPFSDCECNIVKKVLIMLGTFFLTTIKFYS